MSNFLDNNKKFIPFRIVLRLFGINDVKMWLIDALASILLIAVGNCLENVFKNTVMARVMVYSHFRYYYIEWYSSSLLFHGCFRDLFHFWSWYCIDFHYQIISSNNMILLSYGLWIEKEEVKLLLLISSWIMHLIWFGLLIIFFTCISS